MKTALRNSEEQDAGAVAVAVGRSQKMTQSQRSLSAGSLPKAGSTGSTGVKRMSFEDAVGLVSKGSATKSFGRIRRSLESLLQRRGNEVKEIPVLQSRPRPEIKLPKPSLPGIGPPSGDKNDVPSFWDHDGTPDPNSTLYFDRFRKSRSIRVSPDNRFATYRGQPFGGFIVGFQVLAKTPAGRYFEVRIEETDVGRWSDGLGIGFTTHFGESFPKLDPEKYESFACESLPQSWLVGYDGRAQLQGKTRFLKGSDFPKGPWKPSELLVGDVLGVLATEEGHIVLFVNGEHRLTAPFAGIPWRPNLYAVVDLDGCTRTVQMLDSNDGKIPKHVVATKAEVCQGLSKPERR